MSLGVGSDNAGRIVSQRHVLCVMGNDVVGSSDAERFRDDAEVVDSMERDLCHLRPSAGGRRGGWVGVEEFVEVCMVAEELDTLRAACCCCSCCCCSCCDWVGVGIIGLTSSVSWLFTGVREVMEPGLEPVEEWQESVGDA